MSDMNRKRIISIVGFGVLLAVMIPAMMLVNRFVNIFSSYQYVTSGQVMSEAEREEYRQSEADQTLSDSSAEDLMAADNQFNEFLQQNSELLKCDEYGITNILLVGCDAESYDGYIRSDSMMVLSINKTQKTVKIVSLMRDMRVFIPRYDYYDKLNAAMAYDNSCQLLLETIEYNFKIPIDKFVIINYAAFSEIVDLMGGIGISVDPDHVNAINKSISNPANYLTRGGYQTLNGMQSLAFCRMRMVDSDVGRTQRQRDFLTAMIRKLLKSGPETMISAAEVTMPNVMTNMTFGEIVSLVTDSAGMSLYDISQLRIPADGTWYDLVENQIMYIGFNAKKNVRLLHEFLYADAEEAAALASSANTSPSDSEAAAANE